MKQHSNETANRLETGELYLFHPYAPSCPSKESLWGIFDRMEEGILHLETCTYDLEVFRCWYRVPAAYCHHRLATRSELMDYMYNLGVWEGTRHSRK